MMADPELPEWNRQHIIIGQAFLGAISPNFRMIWLGYANDVWIVHVVLARESDEDREEAQDALDQFEALQDGPLDCALMVTVSEVTIAWPAAPARVIYKRREA